jgi:lipopolysaccharide transport system ATP-binding protein
MAIAIKAENISKQYRLGLVGTGTVRDDLKRWYYNVRGKEDPFLKIGDANDRSLKGSSDYVWSLRDINFEINQGDSVGIIGRNGAGKSTLLKILSQVTQPTTGKIFTKGRIASLLEVGTGFHPEMTGRENIYLNGAILGMRKHEINRKFEEIVDFSGVERYIDTPVKRYSSGMYVRLAFAVAAHLESEILIVDEVLAVGDAEFQKKCLGKMSDVSKGEGRTVLFVSHNIGAVNTLTNRCIYLRNGNLINFDDTEKIIPMYLNDDLNSIRGLKEYDNTPNLDVSKPIQLTKCRFSIQKDEVEVQVEYTVRKQVGSVVALQIINSKEVSIITLIDTDRDSDIFKRDEGDYTVSFKLPLSILAPDIFKITLSFSDMKSERFDYHRDILAFEKNNTDANLTREGVIFSNPELIGATKKLYLGN